MMKAIKRFAGAVLLATAVAAGAHSAHQHKDGPVRKEQTAWGIAADAPAAGRTLEVTMTDNMRFTPDSLQVRQGDTVKIVVRNAGAMLHEFVMGDRKTLEEHAALMLKFPDMEHDEPYMAHVQPGGTEQIVWTFNRPGEVDFACLVAGHYQAGMAGKIRVAPRAGTRPTGKSAQ